MAEPFKGWLQGSYQLASKNAALQRTLNLVAEAIEASDKEVGLFKNAPGLAPPTWTLPTSPVRGLLAAGAPLSNVGRMFAAAGSRLYELFEDGTYNDRGDIGNDGSNSPVQMFPNGEQLFIVSAGFAYLDGGAGPVKPTFAGSSYTDLAIDAADATKVRSASIPFVQADVGSNLVITAGGGFTAQTVTVVSVADPADGNVYDDLVIDGSDTTLATSAAHPFSSSDVNTTIKVVGGDGFTTQQVTVLSVAGVQATFSQPLGTLGSTGGQAVQTLQSVATVSAALGTLGSTGGVASQNFGPVTATTGAFLDTFFIVHKPSTKEFYISAPEDGTTWDITDTARKESYPDNIGSIYADHEELYLMGESKSEIWRGPGPDGNFPFQRDPGACMSEGIAAPWTLCGFLDGVAWIGASLRGKPVGYYATGYQPERITTHAIERVWNSYPTVMDAVGFSYELDGHEFWHVSFPSADAAWVYDRTASTQFGKAMWHERTTFDGTAYHRHRANCHAFVWDKHWVGDFETGDIYEMSQDVYEDNGQPMLCQRTLPHICNARLRQFFTKLELDLETGQNGVALNIKIEWSDDGGATFVGGTGQFSYNTRTDQTKDRAAFFQLGSADDRVFRVTVTGNARKALLNAYLEVIEGIS